MKFSEIKAGMKAFVRRGPDLCCGTVESITVSTLWGHTVAAFYDLQCGAGVYVHGPISELLPGDNPHGQWPNPQPGDRFFANIQGIPSAGIIIEVHRDPDAHPAERTATVRFDNGATGSLFLTDLQNVTQGA